MGSAMRRIPYGADASVRKRQDLERAQKEQAAARGLAASQIGSGGTLKVDGSLQVTGSITVPGTLASAGAITAGTTVTAGTDITATGNVNVGGTLNVPNSTMVSAYARSHQVVSGYVALYIDAGGAVLATASGRRFKRDITAVTWTREQRDAIRVVFYRLRAAFILADMRGDDLSTVETHVGLIGEELIEAGFPEFVVLDDKGRVFTVHYELLALIAIDGLQQVEKRMDTELANLRAENDELRKRLDRAGF